jgi:hypothetical protein
MSHIIAVGVKTAYAKIELCPKENPAGNRQGIKRK